MVTLTASHIECDLGLELSYLVSKSFSERVVVALREKSFSSKNHLGWITGKSTPALLRQEEVDVSLPCDVEAVPAATDPSLLVAMVL
jgi:hypothetical protein